MTERKLQEAIDVIAQQTDAYALVYRRGGEVIPQVGNQPDLEDDKLHFRLLAGHLEALHRGSGVPRKQLAEMALRGARNVAGMGTESYHVHGGADGE